MMMMTTADKAVVKEYLHSNPERFNCDYMISILQDHQICIWMHGSYEETTSMVSKLCYDQLSTSKVLGLQDHIHVNLLTYCMKCRAFISALQATSLTCMLFMQHKSQSFSLYLSSSKLSQVFSNNHQDKWMDGREKKFLYWNKS